MSSLKKYRRVKYLGKGSYGAAILVELRSDPSKKFVIKEIVIGHLKPAEQAAAKSEAEVLHQMSHSNITGYVESFVENAKLYIVMEHADGGDLSGAIAKRKAEGKFFAEDEVMRIFVQICLAMKHVHSANILHRDLKSQNIFLTSNGMVKLGDFGIAKVLDASEDQARTQIGTPYYLSPEICESKPYGRKSDVWSLGVVLFEILALEMPFQAQSLPALVLKICSGEPNYKPLETRYSNTLLTLTRSMLCKNPDKRPSVNQIVKTEFIMAHISRLLSYTLKMGNGGVAAPPEAPINSDPALEAARNKQREIEAKDAADRAARREGDREKLRQFRQNSAVAAAAKNKEREAGFNLDLAEESKDNGGRGRAKSPVKGGSPIPGPRAKSPRPLSPRRAASPVRATSPMGGAAGRRVNSNNNLHVDVPVAKPAPRVAPVVQPSGQQQQRAAGNGNSPMSLAEIQAQKQRSNAAAAEAMRNNINANAGAQNNNNRNRNLYEDRSNAMVVQHSNRDDQYESAARREYFANRAAAQAAKARVEADLHGERVDIINGRPLPNRQASIIQQQQQQQQQQAGHARRNSDTEAYQPQQPSSQRSSFDDNMDPEGRIAAIRAQKEKDRERELALKEMQLRQAMEENREGNHKAREKRQAIAFEIDLSAPGEVVNRPVNSRFNRQAQQGGGNSSSASGGSGGGESKDVSPVPDSGSTKSRAASVNSNGSAAATPSNHNNPAGLRREAKGEYQSDIEEDYESISSSAPTVAAGRPNVVTDARSNHVAAPTAVKAKKGWGPPVDPGEIQIAKGVAMYDADKAIASSMFEVPSSRRKSDGTSASAAGGVESDVSRMRLDSLEEDELTDQPSISGSNAAGNDGEVRKFLANKRASLADQKQHARGLLLRLQKQAGKRRITRSINEAKEVHMMVASPSKADAKMVSGAGAAAPSRLKMADIMKSVEAANESVQSAVAVNMNVKYGKGSSGTDAKDDTDVVAADKAIRRPSKSAADAKDSKGGQYDEDVKAVAQLRDQYENIIESDDDLQTTLQSWLDKQKVGVTMRRGGAHPHHGSHVPHAAVPAVAATAEEVQEEEGLTGYDTTTFNQEVEEDSDLSSSPLLSTGAGRGVYLGNDVEVVGMQCMLAKALMGEGDSDDDSDFEDYNGVVKR